MARQDRDDVKVRQIRQAARTLFLRHGFGGVTTAALVKEAGVSKETLYSRYPNKEAVFTDVLEHLISAVDPGASTAARPRPSCVPRCNAWSKSCLAS